MSKEVQENLGTTCPDGGSFYVCDDKPSKFLGCCTVDPCKTDNGACPDDNLRTTSYDKFSHNSITPQTCQSDKPEVRWWTCGATDEPFMGCCSVDACSKNGCPDNKLFAAKLSDDDDDAAVFLPPTSEQRSDGGLSKGAVGGIAAGAAVAALLAIGALVFFFLRRRKRKQIRNSSSYEPYAGQPIPGSNPQSPQMQKTDFNSYTPYPSTYGAPTPSPGHPSAGQASPPYWRGSHQSHHGSVPTPYTGTVSSPDPSQGHFRDSVQSAYGGGNNNSNNNNYVQELPATSEHPNGNQMPNVSDLSYQGGPGRESEVSGMSGWGQQHHVAEMEAPNQGGETR